MANIATLNIGINALYGGALSGINKVTSSFSNMGSSLQRITGTVTSFGTSFVGMAAGITGVGSALGSLTFGVSMAAQAEKTQSSFETMLKSAEAATSLIADLKIFAADTPFEFPGIAAAAKKLLAFGTSADQVIPTLRALGDISSGIDAPLGEIAELYGKMQVQGRLFGEDINQLTGRGIPIIGELAKQFGVADSAVRKLVEEGKIGFPNLQRAIVSLTSGPGIFAGNTAKASKTLSGLWSTAKDNIGMTLESIGKRIIQTFDLKGAVGKLSGFVDYVGTSWVPPIMDHIAFLSTAWTDIWRGLGTSFGDVLETMRTGMIGFFTVSQFIGSNFGDIWELATKGAQLGFVSLGGQITHIFGTVLPETLAYAGRNWRELFTDFVNISTTTFTNIGTNIQNFWTAIFDYLAGNSEGFQFVWTPLTDGFKSSLKEVLKIAPREIGALEQQLVTDVDRLTGKVSGDFATAFAANLAKYKLPEIAPTRQLKTKGIEIAENSAAKMKPAKETFEGPKALLAGSADAFAAIAAFKSRKLEDAFAKNTEKNTEKTAREIAGLRADLKNGGIGINAQVASF